MKKLLVPSDSEPIDYVVTLNHAGGAQSCTCPSHKNAKRFCKHMERAEKNPGKYLEVGPEAVGTISTVGTVASTVKKTISLDSPLGERPLPMLAHPLSVPFAPKPGEYAIEEKYDGHRAIIRVKDHKIVEAWSRTGKDCLRKLDIVTQSELKKLPNCIVDGEIDPGQGRRSHNVSHLTAGKNNFLVFDVLELLGENMTGQTYDNRRAHLEQMFALLPDLKRVHLAPSVNIDSAEQLDAAVQTIWENGGEGVIVKRRKGIYSVGKRTREFMKVKECQPAELLIIGFCPTMGEIMDRGDYARTVLRDDEGNMTIVKTLDDETIARLEKDGKGYEPIWQRMRIGGKNVNVNVNHPWVIQGVGLCIEFHQRTDDGSYRHPRWDRRADE